MSARSRTHAPQSPSRAGKAVTIGSAVVIAATVAGCISEESDPQAADTSSASTTAPDEVVPLSELPADEPLDAGRYALSVIEDDSAPTLPVLSVPEGYDNLPIQGGVQADGLQRYIWAWAVDHVYAHPCDAVADPVGPSVADLAGALAAQELRTATEPVPVSVGGHDGLYLEVQVPETVDAGDCPSGTFGLWPGRAPAAQAILGQVDMIWILDVDGRRVVIDAAHEDASPDEVAELDEMVTTATFEPAASS